MMEWTDRHCRAFHRCFSRHALLYTEMVTADAVIHGERDQLIGFSQVEHPVALQLGGSDPEKLKQASQIGAQFGYDEINLNCGCPSDRVQSGAFGACLMRDAGRVAECVAAMQDGAGDVPVTVKCRIGVDDDDPEQRLYAFIDRVAAAGVSSFTVHARKAWLQGLSPKENRDIPPLDYDLVARLKQDRPELTISLNGGLIDLEHAIAELPRFDGVMLGRAAYHTPELLGRVDRLVFGEAVKDVDAFTAVERYRPYVLDRLELGDGLHGMTRHMLGLFAGQPGARLWRRTLSEKGPRAVGVEAISVLDEALACVRERIPA